MVEKKALAKVRDSIKLVSDLIEKNLNFVNEKKLDGVEEDLWRIAAELEYAASMISIIFGLGDFNPNVNNLDESELGGILILIQDNIVSALALIDKNPREAYAGIRAAIRYTRLAQSKFEK